MRRFLGATSYTTSRATRRKPPQLGASIMHSPSTRWASRAANSCIASTAKNLFGPLCLLVTLQAVNCTTQGVLTGAGLQRFTALCNLVGWYLVAAPLVYGLIWGLDLDLESGPVLLLSCSLAMLTSVIGQTVVLARQDWDVIIAESLQRLHAEQVSCAALSRVSPACALRPARQHHTLSVYIQVHT